MNDIQEQSEVQVEVRVPSEEEQSKLVKETGKDDFLGKSGQTSELDFQRAFNNLIKSNDVVDSNGKQDIFDEQILMNLQPPSSILSR